MVEAVVILVALPMVVVVSKGPACAGSVIDMLSVITILVESGNITRVVFGIGVEAFADVKVKTFAAMIIEFEFAIK